MPLPILCPVCGSKTMAPETALGKRAKCPKCSATLLIPVAILATVIESPQAKSVPAMPILPPVAPVPASPPPPLSLPDPEPIDVEVVEDDPAPLPPPPPNGSKLARPVAKPAAPQPVAANAEDIFSAPAPTSVDAPMASGNNPFAGFVVPGSAAEQMNPKADRKRRDEDDEDDKPRRKRR